MEQQQQQQQQEEEEREEEQRPLQPWRLQQQIQGRNLRC